MSHRILIAGSIGGAQARLERILIEAGYRVGTVGSFIEATRVLASGAPDLVVTGVRLGAYHGVHVAVRCRTVHPELPVIVVGESADESLERDVAQCGGRFVAGPIDRETLLSVVGELLDGRPPSDPGGKRLWPRKEADLPAFVSHTAARIVDLSYGGLRLVFDRSPAAIGQALTIELPELGLSITARLRWASPVEGEGSWWCGAEISADDAQATRTWRWVVDTVH